MKSLIWRNKKNGNLYRVFGPSINTTNSRDGEAEVSYYKDGANPEDLLFNRELSEFHKKFERAVDLSQNKKITERDMQHEKLALTLPWEDIEKGAQKQIMNVLDEPALKKLAIMPDVHQGYSLPIGGVALMDGVIVPTYVGVDIGCGMSATNFLTRYALEDPEAIKEEIYYRIPVRFNQHKTRRGYPEFTCDLMPSSLLQRINSKLKHQLGTLGGGNHFIEIGKNQQDGLVVVVHSGSRGAGKLTADFFMSLDAKQLPLNSREGKEYLRAMRFMDAFARHNRSVMMEEISKALGYQEYVGISINENHNYADITPDGVLHRKGATLATKGQLGVIPGNMRDGTYITRGLGNEEFLCCASHGAGRIMSRGAARRSLDPIEFEAQMDGVCCDTNKRLDEAPGAYKNIHEVINQQDGILVDVVDHILPKIVVKF